MSNKKQNITETETKKRRTKSPAIDVSTLEQIKNHLKEANALIDGCGNPVFIASVHKNTDMAIKKVNQRFGSAKKTEILKAIREGKDIQIL